MKVNAPEKIWLDSRSVFLNKPNKSGLTEYTRTDAFIEKACDFFEEYIEEEDCKIGSREWVQLRAKYESLDSFIRAFVEYMKGE